jgi:hypothetical protein
MSNETVTQEEQILESVDQIMDQPTEVTEPQQELSEIESLKAQRRGHFDVQSMTMDDLKWLRNFLKNSVEFTGPNEAFVILQNHNMLLGEIENHKGEGKNSEVSPVRLPAACIESCLYFLNRAKFTGLHNAQALFKVSFQLNSAYSKVHELDKAIKALETPVEAPKTEETSA